MAINFLFGWASGNNIDIPKKSNGETDIGKLFEMYNNEMNNLAKKTSPEKVEQDLFLKIMDKDYLQQMNAEEIKKAVSVDLGKEKRKKELSASEQMYNNLTQDYNQNGKDSVLARLFRIIKEQHKVVVLNKQNREAGLIDFVQKARAGNLIGEKFLIDEVFSNERNIISSLINDKINPKVYVLSCNELMHIENRHGINGKANQSMSQIDNYKLIEDALHNFDSLSLLKNNDGTIKTTSAYADRYNKPAKLIEYKKKMSTIGTMHVIVAIVAGKNEELRIISAYCEK